MKTNTIQQRGVTLVLYLAFLAFVFLGLRLPPDNDKISCTELNGDGCVCHTTIPSADVRVRVTGPDTLHEGESGIYRMYLSGPPAVGGGYNIAARYGTLDILDTFSILLDNEITQRIPYIFPSVHDTIFWQFKYTAPVGKLRDTIYSCGLSVNLDGIPSELDHWAFGPKFKVSILPRIVPVELSAFTAARTSAGVVLRWETASELNNREFVIERKENNAAAWSSVGIIAGAGTTSERNYYEFTDHNPLGRESAYRLKQIDYNGDLHYSQRVFVNGDDAAMKFSLLQNYPNPFNPSTQITFQTNERLTIALKIYNHLGEYAESLAEGEYEAGVHTVSWNAADHPTGIYYAELRSGSRRSVRKLMLLR